MIDNVFSLLKFGLKKAFPDEEKRRKYEVMLSELESSEIMGQLEINKQEAKHKSIFVAGWRPLGGWICGLGFFVGVLVRPFVIAFGYEMPALPLEMIMPIWAGLIGLRTYEKNKGVD